MLRITCALIRNFGGSAFQFAQILQREMNRRSPDVLLQAMPLRRSWNRNDPRLLGAQPGERNLSGSHPLLCRKCGLNEGDHGRPNLNRALDSAHAHTAKAEGQDFQTTLTKFALLLN